ncbi:MAG: TonB-dependent receptor [Luteitalea sp.]|nr:TonB-dependent receptor [Luteitalea sp.]
MGRQRAVLEKRKCSGRHAAAIGELHCLVEFAPKWVANTAVRYVGPRYRDAANTALIRPYTVVDATVQRNVFANSIVGVTVRNLTDELYARNLYGSWLQWVLGDPRSVEVSLRVRF